MTPSSGTDISADLPSISLFFCRLLHLGRVGEAQDGGKRAPLQDASLARKIASTRPVHLPQREWLVFSDWLVARWPNEWVKSKRETNGEESSGYIRLMNLLSTGSGRTTNNFCRGGGGGHRLTKPCINRLCPFSTLPCSSVYCNIPKRKTPMASFVHGWCVCSTE